MFFDVHPTELKGEPVDRKITAYLDPRGTLQRAPVLDTVWNTVPLKHLYERYPSKPNVAALKQWRSSAANFRDSLHNLVIESSYDDFWRNVVNQTGSLMLSLRSFLSHGSRAYDLVEFDPRDAGLHSECAALVFLACLQLCCNRKSTSEHISPSYHAQILQKLIKLPFLMDFTALYSGANERKAIVEAVWNSCLESNRRLYTDLKIFIRDLGDTILQSLEDKLWADAEDQPNIQRISVLDLVAFSGYICDVVCTVRQVLNVIGPEALAVIQNAGLANRLAQFADKVVFYVNREILVNLAQPSGDAATVALLRIARDKGNLTEVALVESFTCLSRLGSSDAEGYLKTVLKTVQQFKLFALCLEKWSPLAEEIARIRSTGSKTEDATLDMLVHSFKEAFQERGLQWDFSLKDAERKSAVANGNLVSSEQKPSGSGTQNENTDQQVSEIMEMLADMSLDRGYVKACLVHFANDVNATVDAILSGTVPVNISAAVPDEPKLAKNEVPVTVAKGIPALQPTQQNNTEERVIGKVYYGKRDAYEEIDAGDVPEEFRILTLERVERMYNDEYDDTYDEFEEGAAVMPLNEKKDPIVSELKALNLDESDLSDDETPVNLAAGLPRGARGDADGYRRGSDQRGGRGRGRGNFNSNRGGLPQNPPANQINPVGGQQEDSALNSRDPWARQMAQDFARNQTRRDNFERGRGRAGSRGGHSGPDGQNDQKARADKERNKAKSANHNRKDASQWKRGRGAF